MKQRVQFFLLSVTLLSFNLSYAGNPVAVFLHEGFNGAGIPAGWSTVRISGSVAQWAVVGNGSNPTIPPYAGTGQAKFNSFDATSGEQARLTSPVVNLTTATDPFLTFAMYHEDEYLAALDSVYVEVSTVDSVNGPWTSLTGIRRPRAFSGWTPEVISLYGYRGVGRVFLSLRGVSKYGNNMYVDEFLVADSSFHDIGLVALLSESIPTSTSPPAIMTRSRFTGEARVKRLPTSNNHLIAMRQSPQLDIGAVVRNFGTFSEPGYNIAWNVDGQPQQTQSGGNIGARTGQDTLTLDWVNPSSGIHTVSAWTILASDSNRTNDSLHMQFQVLEPGTVFFETFNSGAFPPAGWTTINRDGGALAPWFRGSDTSAFHAFEGSGFAANNFQRNNGTYLDDYLITPPIPGIGESGSKDSLIFWVRSPFYQPPATNFPDSLMILLSTSGVDTSNFTLIVDYLEVPKTGWARKAYSLDTRVPQNSTVRVAFRYLLFNVGSTSGSGDFIGLDAVQFLKVLPTHISESHITPDFALMQNYPNPFNPQTTITFTLPKSGHITLSVFDVLGRTVSLLLNQRVEAGSHIVHFDAQQLPSGVYYYQLRSAGISSTKKMILLH